jgi:hypothetical protein
MAFSDQHDGRNDGSVLPSEESLKLTGKSINEVSHLIERIKNQLAFGYLRLAERYFNSELKIVLRLVVGTGGNVDDFIACYERDKAIFVEPNVDALSDIHSPLVHGSCDGEQKAMLVNNVELMEQPERLIVSLVRLYRTDDVNRVWRDLLYFSIANGRLVLFGTLSNRKVDVAVWNTATSPDKLPHEVVQGTSQVVDSIAEDQGNFVRDGIDVRDVKRRVLNRGYRVPLGPKFVRLIQDECLDSSIKIADVLFGPFNFQSDSVDADLRTHAL